MPQLTKEQIDKIFEMQDIIENGTCVSGEIIVFAKVGERELNKVKTAVAVAVSSFLPFLSSYLRDSDIKFTVHTNGIKCNKKGEE